MATRAELRAYLDRPWERLRELKDRHVSDLVQREGVDAAFAIAAGLAARAAEAGARRTLSGSRFGVNVTVLSA